MIRKLLPIVLLAAIAGCDRSSPEAPATPAATDAAASAPATSTDAAPAPDAAAPAAGTSGAQLLQGVSLPPEFVKVSERQFTNADGHKRMQYVFNAPAGGLDAAMARVTTALDGAGFKPRPATQQPNGDATLAFDRKDSTTVYAIFQAARTEGEVQVGERVTLDFAAQ